MWANKSLLITHIPDDCLNGFSFEVDTQSIRIRINGTWKMAIKILLGVMTVYNQVLLSAEWIIGRKTILIIRVVEYEAIRKREIVFSIAFRSFANARVSFMWSNFNEMTYKTSIDELILRFYWNRSVVKWQIWSEKRPHTETTTVEEI